MKKIIFTAIIYFISTSLFGQQIDKSAYPTLIPYPTNIEVKEGQFALSGKTQLTVNDGGRFINEIAYLQNLLKPVTGSYLSSEKGENVIEVNYSAQVANNEGYTMSITPQKLTITAKSPAGAYYATQTIRQLLPNEIELGKRITSQVNLPAMEIADQPAFEWRGTMIDVSRIFFSIEYLKKHIDRMALQKMNKLHLHLTDDQGWRIEIKKYPCLTSKSAWRNYIKEDSVCIQRSVEDPDYALDPRFIVKHDGQNDLYGGFYTQDQIRDLIEYAASKHIEIIPEIDMPGHMDAVIGCYPELTCTGKSAWGDLFSTPLCACNEETYTFVEEVLEEIIDLFPSQYIHIGADEVDKVTWKNSDACKTLMEKESLKSVDELQSYFVNRVQRFIESKGKKVIGWDEVLDGGINPDINIMYWRGWIKGITEKAVNNGNYVIMSSTSGLYFDAHQNRNTMEMVYNYKVYPDDVPVDKRHLIRGVQANMWTPTIPSENRADFMMFPRMIALSERAWTNKDLFDDFNKRLTQYYLRLDALKINYRLPDLTETATERVFLKETSFYEKSPVEYMTIHYTTDGSLPNSNSNLLEKPLKINKEIQIKYALFSLGGIRGEINTVNYKPSVMQKPSKVNAKNLKPGLSCDLYKAEFKKVEEISGTPEKFIVTNIKRPKGFRAWQFGLKYCGYINIPEAGIYSFFVTHQDGSILRINNQVIVDNNDLHNLKDKSAQVALEKGLHPINFDLVESGDGYVLKVQYSFNGGEVKDIPDNWFMHSKN